MVGWNEIKVVECVKENAAKMIVKMERKPFLAS